MIKIKFSNEEVMREVALSLIGNHVVEIIGLSEANLTGFETFRYSDEKKLGDFSDYTTLFRTVDGGFQFSNDGSVYPYVPDPTTPEKIATLQSDVAKLESTTSTLTMATKEMNTEVSEHSTEIADNSDGIFELATATDENSSAMFEMADYVASLEERIAVLEGSK